jgi:DNA polymerase-3 subunit beta
MKATIERAVLLKSLGHVQSVVERRNTIPILSNVLIEADASGQLKLMATDLDLQVVETIAAKVETAGTTTVSAPRSRRGQDAGQGRPVELQPADLAAR